MYGEESAKAIDAGVWGLMLDRGLGTISATSLDLGMKKRGLENARARQEGLRVKEITGIIDVLGIPPSVFFDEVFGGSAATAADHFMARGAQLPARGLVDLPELAAVTKPDRLTEDDLARLDTARFEDPRAAAEQAAGIASQAARDGRRGDLAAAVARQGSALRVAEEWEAAWVCVWWALKQEPQGAARADTWLRGSLVVSDYGLFHKAADLARLAMIGFMENGDLFGAGRALTNHGVFLRRSEDLGKAIPMLQAALVVLPDSAAAHHALAVQNLALAHLSLGNLNKAERLADDADAIKCAPSSFSVHLQWIRARIAGARQDHGRAIELYGATIPALEESPGDAALISAELCRVHLKAGAGREAVSTALGMVRLTLPESQNPIVAAAILDLFRSAQKGSVSLDLAEETVASIRQALRRRAATRARPASG